MSDYIIAVDFDGTLCENAWPGIGEARAGVIDYVLGQQMTGAKIILWTNRRGEKLEEAVRWCAARGLAFDAVNENLPEVIERFGGDTRKVFAHEYLDDRAVLPDTESLSWEEADALSPGERGSSSSGYASTTLLCRPSS